MVPKANTFQLRSLYSPAILGNERANADDLLEIFPKGKFPATSTSGRRGRYTPQARRQSFVYFIHSDDSTMVKPKIEKARSYTLSNTTWSSNFPPLNDN
ncbi:hypothetical protein TCAL_15492 [Tigriopus californicus]|uniref:Uncharacterized protein n=1 Tax=Tigriopus californicus TaxID=6832 RepID=A0A553PRY1_TIGCA|nr:hypothetical protein TCAL_15492 [Tigriopus californicus]